MFASKSFARRRFRPSHADSVRQGGVKCGVVELAMGQAAMVAISVGTASIVGGMSSAMASVCM